VSAICNPRVTWGARAVVLNAADNSPSRVMTIAYHDVGAVEYRDAWGEVAAMLKLCGSQHSEIIECGGEHPSTGSDGDAWNAYWARRRSATREFCAELARRMESA